MYLIKIFSELQNDLKYASNERILLEVAMLKLCSITEEKNIDDISAKLDAIAINTIVEHTQKYDINDTFEDLVGA